MGRIVLFLVLSLNTLTYANNLEHDPGTQPSARPETESKETLVAQTLADLHQVFAIELSGSDVTLNIRSEKSTVSEARARLRKRFEGQTLGSIQKALEGGVLQVWDAQLKKHVPYPGKSIVGAVLSAVGYSSRDGLTGRRLYLEDTEGLLGTFPISVRDGGNRLSSLNTIVASLMKTKNSERLKLSPPRKSGVRLDFIFEYSASTQSYERVKDSARLKSLNEKEIMISARRDPQFAKALQAKAESYRHIPTSFDASAFVGSEKILPLWSEAAMPESAENIKKGLTDYARKIVEGYADYNNPANVKIRRDGLAPNTPFVYRKEEGTPRIALIYTDGNSGTRQYSSQAAGAATYFVNSVSEGINKIQAEFKKYGEPMDVMFCSHGSPGNMTFFGGGSQADELCRCTRGMVNRAFTLGCSVGGGAESSNHLMRRLAVRLNAPVHAVDQTLWGTTGGVGWHIQSSGNLVSVFPAHPDIELED